MAEETTPDIQTGQIPSDTFQIRLVLARMHAGGLTIKQAAEKCGLNYGSWSNWERGMMPRDQVDVAQRIADGLGIDFDWLLFGGPLAREHGRPGRALQRRAGTGEIGRVSDSTAYRPAAERSANPRPTRPPNRPTHRTRTVESDSGTPVTIRTRTDRPAITPWRSSGVTP